MKAAKLFKFSSIMFFAVGVYLFLTALTQGESRFLYAALAAASIAAAVLTSAKSRGVKDK